MKLYIFLVFSSLSSSLAKHLCLFIVLFYFIFLLFTLFQTCFFFQPFSQKETFDILLFIQVQFTLTTSVVKNIIKHHKMYIGMQTIYTFSLREFEANY